MTPEEVGAATCTEARKQYNELKGNKPRKPYKILRQVTGREVGRYYVCLYHDIGMPVKTTKKLTQKTTSANFLDLLSRTN